MLEFKIETENRDDCQAFLPCNLCREIRHWGSWTPGVQVQHGIYTCEIWKAPKNNASVTIGNSPSSQVPQLNLVYHILSSCMFPAVASPDCFFLCFLPQSFSLLILAFSVASSPRPTWAPCLHQWGLWRWNVKRRKHQILNDLNLWVGKISNSMTLWQVGPRDGLQNEKTLVPTEVKVEFIRWADVKNPFNKFIYKHIKNIKLS